MTGAVLLTVEDGVATLLLNRPDKLNAVNLELRQDLIRHIETIEADGEIRAVLLTGEGRAFCSGADQSGPRVEPVPPAVRQLLADHHKAVTSLWSLSKPLVGAVRGPAVGIGWSYALCCDVVYASETTQFWQPLIGRGGIPDGGAIWLLARQLGALKAQDLVYSQRKVAAREALELGLVTEVVEDSLLQDVALARARELAGLPLFAIQLCKSLFHTNESSLEDYLSRELGHVPLATMARFVGRGKTESGRRIRDAGSPAPAEWHMAVMDMAVARCP